MTTLWEKGVLPAAGIGFRPCLSLGAGLAWR